MVKVNSEGPWLGVDGRIWRHTIGRVSNGVRVPINLIAAFLQGAKIIGKSIAVPLTYAIVGIHAITSKDHKTYKGSMSLRGIAIDGIGFIKLLENVSICALNAIVAPNVESKDFVKGLKGTWVVISGGLQEYPKVMSISRLFDKIVLGKKDTDLPKS
jgi:hypothetical protein